MAKKRPPTYHDQRVSGEKFGRDLQGLGQHALVKQRGLRGTKLGPANDGRRLSPEERRAIVEKMKLEGKL